ncbi:MAG: four helix bundle protein [Burkholderiales bacterium]
MTTFKSFEEMEVWQKARSFTRKIYSISDQRPFCKDFGLRDQIRRASVSVMANIAEGFERSGNAEFTQFLAIAKGSLGEVAAQLYVAFDQRYITREIFDELGDETKQLGSMLGGLIKYIKKSGMKGLKYK